MKMTGAELFVFLLKFGPIGLSLAEELTKLWTTDMSPEQIAEFCRNKRKSLEAYAEAERASRIELGTA